MESSSCAGLGIVISGSEREELEELGILYCEDLGEGAGEFDLENPENVFSRLGIWNPEFNDAILFHRGFWLKTDADGSMGLKKMPLPTASSIQGFNFDLATAGRILNLSGKPQFVVAMELE